MNRTLIMMVAALSAFACSPVRKALPLPNSGPALKTRSLLSPAKAEAARSRIKVDRLTRDSAALHPPHNDATLPDYQPLHASEPDFDAVHYRVSLDFPAISETQQAFDGEVELTFKPLAAGYQVLSLDSAGLAIQSVKLLNTFEDLRYEQRDERLDIDLNRAYGPADTLAVAIKYHWARNPNQGVYFRSRTGVAGIETVYSQSEAEESRYWFPGNSRPNDKATFESIIRLPAPFVAVSNGSLSDMTEESGMRTYRWSQQIPMASYLFVVTAGKFGVHRTHWKDTPVEYYGPADDMERLSYSLRNTPDMIDFFSTRTGFAYPYEKYAQVVVPQYMWGGMEHVTATTLTDRTVHGPAEDDQYSSASLTAHELAHQWFGDLITCKNWDHLWLNEGFATYFDALYAEHSLGRAELLADLADGADWYFSEEDKDARPVVFPFFRYGLDDYFDSRAYPKGAWVLHMLRNMLGDETFFGGIRTYLFRNQQTVATTENFRKAMEDASGRDLGWFFDQWLYKPGYPKFDVKWAYDAATHEVALDVAQTQNRTLPGGVAGLTPLFQGTISVELDGVIRNIELKGATAPAATGQESFRLASAEAPRYVKFNAESGWLGKVETHQDLAAWQAQLAHSLDVTARIEAAGALASSLGADVVIDSPEVTARTTSLADCARKDGALWVRTSCLDAMGTLLDARQDLTALATTAGTLLNDSEWKVREAAAKVLGRSPVATALPLLRTALHSETKVAVLVAVIGSLGKLKSPELYDLLVAELGRDSYQDKVRQAVLDALGSLSDLRSLTVGEEYIGAAYAENMRKGAISLLAALGKAFPAEAGERARLAVEGVLTDSSYQVRMAAVGGLGKLKNPKSLDALQRVAAADSDLRVRAAAHVAITQIQTR